MLRGIEEQSEEDAPTDIQALGRDQRKRWEATSHPLPRVGNWNLHRFRWKSFMSRGGFNHSLFFKSKALTESESVFFSSSFSLPPSSPIWCSVLFFSYFIRIASAYLLRFRLILNDTWIRIFLLLEKSPWKRKEIFSFFFFTAVSSFFRFFFYHEDW